MSHTSKAAKMTTDHDSASGTKNRWNVLIMGAAGYDYHVFNLCFRGDSTYNVKAFTFASEQNVGTSSGGKATTRSYPKELAGPELYPEGIPFYPETELESLIHELQIDVVVFAYSDISHEELMHRASRVLASGADYWLIAPKRVQLKSSLPIIGVTAVRTGVGKSSVARAMVRFFKHNRGKRVVAVREPMPYSNNLERQACMRFEKYSDFDYFECTVEEREEYEPYIEQGLVIYSGVDYERILREAEKESDVIVWDGGNNEISFFETDYLFVMADPLRAGHETKYHPGEVNCRMADCFILAKCHEAQEQDMQRMENILGQIAKKEKKEKKGSSTSNSPTSSRSSNDIPVIRLTSTTKLQNSEDEAKIKGKRVVVVEDGPTTTHGGMSFGAGFVMAKKLGVEIVDPRPFAVGNIKRALKDFPHLEQIVPAMGYSAEQLDDLVSTLNAIDADVILNGSPTDLAALFKDKLKKPMYRVMYDVAAFPTSKFTLDQMLTKFATDHRL